MSLPKVDVPNVHLFAFHLRNTPTTGSGTQVVEDADLLWKKLGDILDKYGYEKPLDLFGYYPPKGENTYDPTEEPKGSIVNLYKNGILDFKGTVEIEGQLVTFTGIACPRRMYDSYALSLNIRRPERESDRQTEAVSISIFRQFNKEACILLPDFLQSSLGQTLLITADLTQEQKQFAPEGLKQLAEQCIHQFIPDSEKRPEFNSKGRLFGSPIFEFGQLADLETASPYRHILVLFFRDEAMKNKFEGSYWNIVEIFYYRNKIISQFKETRKRYSTIEKKYQDIEENIESIDRVLKNLPIEGSIGQKILQQLKNKLRNMPSLALEYSRLQGNLERDRVAIAFDTNSYIATLEKIRRKQELDLFYLKPVDLSFLETFITEESPSFQERIKADLDYFSHGKGLVEQAIAAIGGIIDIEHADRARNLETKLEAIAAGLGAATVIAVSSTHLVANNPIRFPNTAHSSDQIHPFFTSIVLSLSVGIIVFALFAGILTWIRKRK